MEIYWNAGGIRKTALRVEAGAMEIIYLCDFCVDGDKKVLRID